MTGVIAVDGNLVVADFGGSGARPPLTKKQVAQVLGRSERWIELRVAEGMPAATDPRGRRIFDLSEVRAWLHEKGRSVA